MNEDLINAISRMPNNWWKTKKWCSLIASVFKGYILGLLFTVNSDSSNQATIFSGFLWKNDNLLLWITAGHVLDKINLWVNHTSTKPLFARWLDWEGGIFENTIPVDFNDLCIPSSNSFPDDQSFLDLGMIILGSRESTMIAKNHYSIPFTEEKYEEVSKFEPEGFILLGFPNQLNSFTWDERRINSELKNFSYSLIALPLESIPFSSDFGFKKKDPDAFYGRLIEFQDFPEDALNIIGMSGGPILAIKRDQEKGIDYRIVAIQHGWLEESRIIQAEPISRVIKLFKDSESKLNLE